jgi:putative ABC transport system substrate-binding protein
MDGLQQAAASLLGRGVPIIVASVPLRHSPRLKLTHSVPIVTLSSDPVRSGMAESFAHPGRNVTGIGQWVELLPPM